MRAYLVTYDLNRPGQNYADLIEELKRSPEWWHYLKSSWIIATNETAAALWQRVKGHLDASDSVLIVRICNDTQGWLPKEAWDWINAHVPTC